MLSEKDKEKILRLRQEEDLSYEEIHKKTKFARNTIMNICREKARESQEKVKENQEESKKQEVHFDDPIEKVRAIPESIDKFIEMEQLKADDRVEWEKRKEDIREILRIEVDDKIAEEREDATEISDGQWRVLIKKEYDKKEIATNLRSVLMERDTAIKDLTKDIEEEDEVITNLRNKNISLNNDNTALQETNADLNDHIENYLDDAGRREKIACVREQNKLKQERSSLDRYIRKMSNWRSELDQRDGEQDERDKKLSELQKLLDDQADKQQIERKEITQEQDRTQKLLDAQVVKQQRKATELEQKEYELKQKGDAIAATKKDLMDFAGEIGRELSVLSRVKKEIERNKHLLFLRGEHEKVLERISLS